MPAFDNSWSRLVFWLKIILPIVALAILSTLFLLSRASDPERLIPFSTADVEELAREQGLGGAEVSGVTSDGAALTIRTRTARPGVDGGPARAEGVSATYEATTGFRADVTSDTGTFDRGSQILTLDGSVKVVYSTGITVLSDQLVTALDQTRLTSPGPVTATAPYGRIDAGGMLLEKLDAQGPEVLVFNNGVRLIYDPKDRDLP